MTRSEPTTRHTHRRAGRSAFAGLVLLWAAACAEGAGQQARFDSGVPGMRTSMEITDVKTRGPYLEATLRFANRDAWAWVLPSESCNTVLRAGQTVDYVDNGPQGVFSNGELRCQSMGFGPLDLWRDRKSRATPAGIPRSQATYRTIHLDDDVALIRGVLPQAVLIGFERSDDLVAVVPRGGECETPIERGVASLEYRGKGKNVLSLVGPTGLCAIRAILLPPSSARPRGEAKPVDE